MVKSKVWSSNGQILILFISLHRHFRNPPFFTPLLHQFSDFCYYFITISKQNWNLFYFLCLNWIWIGLMQMFSWKSKNLNIIYKDILHNYWILFLTRFSTSEMERNCQIFKVVRRFWKVSHFKLWQYLEVSSPLLKLQLFWTVLLRSSYIFIFWFLVFWSLLLRDFLSVFFFPFCPSSLAKCKQSLSNIFIFL